MLVRRISKFIRFTGGNIVSLCYNKAVIDLKANEVGKEGLATLYVEPERWIMKPFLISSNGQTPLDYKEDLTCQ